MNSTKKEEESKETWWYISYHQVYFKGQEFNDIECNVCPWAMISWNDREKIFLPVTHFMIKIYTTKKQLENYLETILYETKNDRPSSPLWIFEPPSIGTRAQITDPKKMYEIFDKIFSKNKINYVKLNIPKDLEKCHHVKHEIVRHYNYNCSTYND